MQQLKSHFQTHQRFFAFRLTNCDAGSSNLHDASDGKVNIYKSGCGSRSLGLLQGSSREYQKFDSH